MLTACGPAPQAEYADDEAPSAPQPAPVQTVYVVVGEASDAPPTEVWIPEETHGDNPFARTRTWIGDYDCPQGNTELTLRVIQVRGDTMKAVFDFHHVESAEAGKYLMVGSYDEETRTATFAPGAWLVRPPNYVTVGMSGDVALDGSLFAGRIDHPECGAFRLRPAR
jgi:hypothetical protein